MNQEYKTLVETLRDRHKEAIKEADNNPNKWYELFVDEGEEIGTHTEDDANTFDEIIQYIEHNAEKYGLNNIAIDIWECHEAPREVLSLSLMGDDEPVPMVLQTAAFGHQIEVTLTKIAGVEPPVEVPNCIMFEITTHLSKMSISGEFSTSDYPTQDGIIHYIGTWRVVPVIDHNFMARIAFWVSSFSEGEGLTQELFHETYGSVMGDHYRGKWENLYHHNIMKMVAYFGLKSTDGERFCAMIQKQMLKYEKRIGRNGR